MKTQDLEGSFNTGRKYTTNGQRIGYRFVDGGTRVIFADFDRMIYGEFDWLGLDIPMRNADLMRIYDAHDYRMSCEAMQLRSDAFDFPARYL